jgi:tetratricopeptide (TPR) repeat protein
MPGFDSATLRAWRRSRGWDVPEMARQLRTAARAAGVHVAAHAGLIRMIYAWERGDHALSERYALLYRAAIGTDSTVVAVPEGDTADDQLEPGPGLYEVPFRAQDGRIVYVTVPRRTFLAGTVGVAALAVTPPDDRPAERFLAARRALRDNDNLFGPRDVIPLAARQLQIIQRVADGLRGTDRRELLLPQIQFADLLGWLYQDSCEYGAAQHWLDRALEWAHLLADHSCVTFILCRKAQLACDSGHPGEAISLAEAAMRAAGDDSVLGAVAATYGAHAYALDGDAAASSRLYDLALADAGSGTTPWAAFFDPAYIGIYRAQSRAVLGDHAAAAEGFGEAIRRLRPSYRRDRGVYQARQARAFVGAGEPEHAAAIGLHALTIATETRSARILTELATLEAAVSRAADTPAVAAFRDAMTVAVPHA